VKEKPADKLKKNEIAVVKIAFSDKIVCDKFKNHKTLGEFILIDRVTGYDICLLVWLKRYTQRKAASTRAE
jgi:sulfate adenylyltransferase subunit 1 (EFTu-like GTPase family)